MTTTTRRRHRLAQLRALIAAAPPARRPRLMRLYVWLGLRLHSPKPE